MTIALPPQEPLRSPDEVMRLERMGSMFPSRMSFLRVLMRRLGAEDAKVIRPVWQISEEGFGHAVYALTLGGHVYSLVAFSNRLDPDERTDRVIAQAWDAAFVLYDGTPDDAEIQRLRENAPKQEAGRFSERDLVLSRANKSVRLFAEVTNALRAGRQPDATLIGQIGYLMRTTAVYGNGKFGIADRQVIAERPGLEGPFAAEMLTVWLIRGFTHDLVEHVGGATLDRNLKRHLGIGNSTGLGMAPFLVSHPELLNNWMIARETALARVRAVATLTETQRVRMTELAERASRHLQQWNVPDADQQARIECLRRDWADLMPQLNALLDQRKPLDQLVRASQVLSVECQELVVSLVLEPFGDLVDGLTDCMGAGPALPLDARMDVAALRATLQANCGWALNYNFDDPREVAQFWYVSEEKQEPRLGLRHEEPGGDLESPLDIARQLQALAAALDGEDGSLADFLRSKPQHRDAARRVQLLMTHPYSEIRDNLICDRCRPIDMLRCKLSFFGAAKFDPKSDRWTRITLAQGAPLHDELGNADDWWLPVFDA
ncbi:hypothetical protein [Litoreibacter janthinus]|uniref:Uncharacterized protein n=1 Tax=Litoreibacter janthinus TaxID=670154 RepID=A0A1I6G6H4_9RHOB|nr:hypothetical protein [Litoreibacter janthinus]SFR37750.1 hypothetical protein SAMN04488002_0968 [Litoreibacter janthinus]